MIEVDFGNPEAPLTNTPQWADTLPDPHGRATELKVLVEVGLPAFYETGIAENLCDGPCDQDDLN